jgi:NADH-quinone oxidoreductase subunit M
MHVAYTNFPFLSAILLSCVGGLLVILFIPEDKKDHIKWVSAVCSGITLIISIYLFFAYDKSQGGLQFVEKVRWIPSMGISYFNGADGFGLPMLLLTGIVFFTGVLTMWELETRVKEFFALVFLLVTGVFGLFMSMDLFFIFVWFDVSLFPMYLLIAVWGSTRKEYGAMKLTLYLLAGSALVLWLSCKREPLAPFSRNLPFSFFISGLAFWPACGRFTPGRRWAMWRRRLQSA